jgi:hypothetical protein
MPRRTSNSLFIMPCSFQVQRIRAFAHHEQHFILGLEKFLNRADSIVAG